PRVGTHDPGLPGPRRPGAEHQRVPAQGADISVLCRGACAHGTLAQIDFLEARPGARGVVVEQRALRDCQADRALDVAGHQFVAASELLDSASRTRRDRSTPSREPERVTWLPRCSATTPSRRSISARFCPYWPNGRDASRFWSKASTI